MRKVVIAGLIRNPVWLMMLKMLDSRLRGNDEWEQGVDFRLRGNDGFAHGMLFCGGVISG
ncbi:MAG: hypothetical protein R8J85_05210 [Mariprofundales bacterium]